MLRPEHIRGIYEGFYKLAEEIGNPEYTQNTARIVKMLLTNPGLVDEDLRIKMSHAFNQGQILVVNEEYCGNEYGRGGKFNELANRQRRDALRIIADEGAYREVDGLIKRGLQ